MDKGVGGLTAEQKNEVEKKQLGTVGVKYDHGKPRIGLVATEFIVGIAEVLTLGAEKYTSDNWKLGMDYRRVYDSMQRHFNSWYGGEDLDPESGKSHLYHAGTCLMFLTSYQHHNLGEDNREHKVYERIRLEQQEAAEGIETITLKGEDATEYQQYLKGKDFIKHLKENASEKSEAEGEG